MSVTYLLTEMQDADIIYILCTTDRFYSNSEVFMSIAGSFIHHSVQSVYLGSLKINDHKG